MPTKHEVHQNQNIRDLWVQLARVWLHAPNKLIINWFQNISVLNEVYHQAQNPCSTV